MSGNSTSHDACHHWSSIIYGLNPHLTLALGTGIVALSLPTLFLNSAVLISLVASHQTSTTPGLLMACLSATDLLGGSFAFVFFAGLMLRSYLREGLTHKCILENSVIVTFSMLYTFFLCLTVLLAVDRYLHMKARVIGQSRLEKMFKRPQIFVLLILCVAISVLNSCFFLSGKEQAVVLLVTMFMTTTVLCVTTILYTRGYLAVRRITETNPVHQSASGKYSKPTYLRSLYKSVLFLILTSIFSHTPIVIGMVMHSACTLTQKCSSFMDAVHSYTTFSFTSLYCCFLLDGTIILYYNARARAWLRSNIRVLSLRSRTVDITNSSTAQ